MAERPLKILLAVHRFHPEIGGVEVTAELLARGFTERHGAQVVVVTHTPEGDVPQDFPFTVLRAPSARELFAAVKGSDVIFHNNPCLRFSWPQLLVRRPWVVVLRMWLRMPDQKYSLPQRLKNAMKIAIVRRADRLISNSIALSDHTGRQAKVIYNSYRSDLFHSEIPSEQRPANSLVYLGRLSSDKGISFLLSALAQLKAQGREYQLTLIGEGPYRDELEQQVADLDLTEQVHFRGVLHREQINVELNQHRIGIVPSEMPEPFGTVGLELMGAGCLTLVADHGGLPEAVGDAGAKFTPKSPQALAESILRLSDDETYAQQLRQRMPAHLAEHQESVMIDKFYAELKKAAHRE